MNKLVSVIVPCFNEEKYISTCLDSILSNGIEDDKLEIIIVDGGSTDNTLKIIDNFISRFESINLIHNPHKITPKSLNIGIKNAIGKYIMIASAHSKFCKGYINQCIITIKKYNADVVGGVIKTSALKINQKTQSIISVLSSPIGVGNSMFRIGVNEIKEVDTVPYGVYKREVFDEVGLYNEKLIRNQDIEFSKRLLKSGKKILLIPNASCTYYARDNFSELAKNNYLNGLWNILTLKITRDFHSLSIRHFIPLIFILSLLIPAIFAAFLWKFLIFISLISLFLYFVLLFTASLKISNRSNSIMFLLFTFVIVHFSYGFGSLMGIFRR